MYIGFGRFLAALCVVGVALGAVFGLGMAVGRGDRTMATAATTPSTGSPATGQSVAPGVGGEAPLGGGGDGAGVVSGAVEAITPTSITIRTNAGATVSLALNAQTAVRKIEAGSLEDVQAGSQVLVTRDASSVATNVQLVPQGAAGRAGGGTPGPRGTQQAR
jgi:hypothetical protein